MAMRKKPSSADDFVMQASTVIEQKQTQINKSRKTELRFPENLYLSLDKHLETLDIKASRNQWILWAIKEKLDREQAKTCETS